MSNDKLKTVKQYILKIGTKCILELKKQKRNLSRYKSIIPQTSKVQELREENVKEVGTYCILTYEV